MQPSDPARDPGGGKWGHVWLNTNQLMNNRNFGLAALARKIDALAAVAAADKDVNADELNEIVDRAVAAHTPPDGEISPEQRAVLEDVVREVVPGEQGEEILAKLVERLSVEN